MRAIVGLGLLVLAGCAAGYSRTGLGRAESAAFHCPKPGTITTFTTGNTLRYTGQAADNPTTCTGIFRDGTASTRVYGYYQNQTAFTDAAAAALGSLFPTQQDKAVSFTAPGMPIGAYGQSQRYTETWTTAGSENLTIGDKVYKTVVFDREEQGADASNTALVHYRLWYAPDPGVWVRGTVDPVRGYTNVRPFAVESIVVP